MQTRDIRDPAPALAVFTLLSCVVATGALAADAATLLRTTLTVADVDRSLAFYALLGFRVESEMGGERNPDSPFPLNSRSSRWRLVILAPAGKTGGKIGLLSFDDTRPAPTRDAARERIALGDMVFVFGVPDGGCACKARGGRCADRRETGHLPGEDDRRERPAPHNRS